MLKKTATIVNRLGLHARPSAALVSTASRYEATVFLTRDHHSVNGKSIMGVMTLAAELGSELIIEVDGPDEEEAMQAILDVIASGFGEMD
ncbi:MAG: HPr family phosphocarrier protein [candidate division Zixibacteria bacterium]|nr:HPr family phosphocarrier protein [candidate division Zixibacteria bacterium]